MITRTYTKTYEVLNPWAETTPVARDYAATYKGAREGDQCCGPRCDELLRADEVCYAVVELDQGDANPDRGEPWVCWRHVRSDDGPIRVPIEPCTSNDRSHPGG